MTDTDALSELTERYLEKENRLGTMNVKRDVRQLSNHLVTLAPAQHSEFY
jgi:hypothetical protein